jgi:transcriptional regulator with AAA-type ATPase domain
MQTGDVIRLVVTVGPSAGATLLLTRARATVGRHRTNDLVLDDPRVSSVHLELERRGDGRILVRDLDAASGTWLGPHRMLEAELGPGAELRLGDSGIRIEANDQALSERSSEEMRFGGLLGASPEMRELFTALERIAPTPLTLLVQGEPGTGKEELARAVHARSARRNGPFVILDAANLPVPLAARSLACAFERAHGGTLFLAGVGELPLHVQLELLTALDRRLDSDPGERAAGDVDVRLIAATCRDLRLEVEAYRFREDLYQRLAEARVVVPPLRSRTADISLLALHFVEVLMTSSSVLWMTREALKSLEARRWPGNVRELRNVVLRSAALCADGLITEGDLADEGSGFRGGGAERGALDLRGTYAEVASRAAQRFEADYLETLLRRCGGDLLKASHQAGLTPNELRKLIHATHALSFDEEPKSSRAPAVKVSRSSWSPTRLAEVRDELADWVDGDPKPGAESSRNHGGSGVENMEIALRGSSHPAPTLGQLCKEARLDSGKNPFEVAYAGARDSLRVAV